MVQEGFGEGEFVNVGWGKKETQFHGTEGKEARTKATEKGDLSQSDDRKVGHKDVKKIGRLKNCK